jgi:hypothetical protein
MKRKKKSGHEKRMRKSLKEAASATEQKSLLTSFEKNFNVNATENRVQQPSLSEKESNIIAAWG